MSAKHRTVIFVIFCCISIIITFIAIWHERTAGKGKTSGIGTCEDIAVAKGIGSAVFERKIPGARVQRLVPFINESIVTEVGHLIQDKQSQKKKINDLKGDFLERAKKYYKHILKFDLYSEEKVWQQIRMLSTLRNAFAHANGRLEMLNEKSKKKIKKWEKEKRGISTYSGYIICEANIVADIFGAVRDSLEDLIERYKHWDGP